MGHKGSKFIFLASFAFMLASCGGGGASQPGISPSVETAGIGGGLGGMSLGGIDLISFSGSQADVDLTGIEDGFLIVNSTSQIGDDLTIQLTRSSGAALALENAALAIDPGSDEEPAAQFHQYLREIETVMQESGEFSPVTDSSASQAASRGTALATAREGSQAGLAAAPAALSVGDTETFRVLNSINSITSFDDVNGQLRLATDNLYIYVDQNGADRISDEDLKTLAHNFEGIALPRQREIMGRESDINLDGHISILMTCVVNRMASSGGIVTGFFFPGDLHARNSLNQVSNGREIFYTLLPDPSGNCGASVSAKFAVENILPGVLAHEYQHMNSFNQHVFKSGGSTEEPWLNEGLSHFFENYTGFGNEIASRVKLFLAQPSKTPLIPATSPTLAERGACLTFLSYLYEQSDDGRAFLTNLYASNLTGVANLEASFNGKDASFSTFPQFVSRWSIALSLAGTGLTSDPQYNFKERGTDPETGNLTGIILRGDAQDGRGTLLDGPVMTSVTTFPTASVVSGTATQFYRLKSASGPVRLSAAGSPDLSGALVRLQKN